MSAVLFFLAATGAIAGAVGVVLLRDPFYSVLALVGHLVSLALLFLLLRSEFIAAVRDGDIVIPRLEPLEPLREQLAHFIECIVTGKPPLTSAEDGVAIVRVLEWAERELGPAARAETTQA